MLKDRPLSQFYSGKEKNNSGKDNKQRNKSGEKMKKSSPDRALILRPARPGNKFEEVEGKNSAISLRSREEVRDKNLNSLQLERQERQKNREMLKELKVIIYFYQKKSCCPSIFIIIISNNFNKNTDCHLID